MVQTSIAITTFFTGHPRVDAKVAPRGSLALIAITLLALANFTTLISGSASRVTALLVLVAAVFVAGISFSFRGVPEKNRTGYGAPEPSSVHCLVSPGKVWKLLTRK
jgi:hypothetical protein